MENPKDIKHCLLLKLNLLVWLNCTKQALRYKKLFKAIFNQEIKFKIIVDKKTCIARAQDSNSKGRRKHIDIRM